jgi:long-subunit acyl-CoA synthetase (AMP-forming)
VGRKDDVIILSTGEKTVPGPMEDAISASRLVNAAVIFGRERSQVGVLIEPKAYPEDPNAFIDDIWPYIETANADAPAFSRIVKHMVLLTKPNKNLLRADKGTIKKKASVAAYAEEIQVLCAILCYAFYVCA